MIGLMLLSLPAMGGACYLFNRWLQHPLTVLRVVGPFGGMLAALLLDWHQRGEASFVGQYGLLVMLTYLIELVASGALGLRFALRATQVDP